MHSASVALWLIFLSTLPAMGATLAVKAHAAVDALFLSTLPARGATKDGYWSPATKAISIHAPREGSDATDAEDLPF